MCAVSLLIADDHEIVRRGLCALVAEQSGWKIVAEAKDGREALAKADQFKPDVAVLDVSMPLLNGLDAAEQIAKISPRTKVLILTVHDSHELISKVLSGSAWIYPQDGCGARSNNGGKGAAGEQNLLYAKSGPDGDGRIFKKRAKGK